MDKEEILINSQLALFFDGLIERPDQLVESFNADIGNIFNQIPVVVPVPNEPQLSEIPVVQLFSDGGVYSCNIARSRVDFFVAGVGRQKFSDIENDLLEKIEKYHRFFSSKIAIKRIGFVSRFFIEDELQDRTIVKLLKDKFKKIHDGDTYEVYIRYVSRDIMDDFEINNFTTVEKFFAKISGVNENIKGVLITRDFNTIPEKSNEYKAIFSTEKIKSFINEGKNKFRLNDIKEMLWKNN